jgi:predicted RNA-binding protein Jag
VSEKKNNKKKKKMSDMMDAERGSIHRYIQTVSDIVKYKQLAS